MSAHTVRSVPGDLVWQFRPDLFSPGEVRPVSGSHENGSQLGQDVSIFHDASDPLYLINRINPVGGTPSLRMTCYRFQGTFLSLAMALPNDQTALLRSGHEMVLEIDADASRPVALDTRLNISIDGEIMVLFSHRIVTQGRRTIIFDLQHLDLRASTVGNAWCDLIFRNPEMIEIELSDLALALRQRDGD
ncbi:MAG: DUF6478 family protein, partial [Pseudomonadota bacterium]